MTKWQADFKDGSVIEFAAFNREHARATALEIAYDHGMVNPLVKALKQLGIEEEKKEMLKGQPRPNVSGPVLSYLQSRVGKTTSLEQIKKATKFSDDQIRSALANFRAKKTGELETITQGHMWRWLDIESKQEEDTTKPEVVEQVEKYINNGASEEVPDDEKGFYMLSTAKDGALILQRDSDGSIWRAERI